ncbi:MAG: hypothetical protein PHT94_04370 [Candidatus Nanoarchaeia archaeon]|nr:hypothetical protein [Candidatus Nanoarchaeia archaeon]
MAKKTCIGLKKNITLISFFLFVLTIFTTFVNASYVLDYDINTSMYVVKLNSDDEISIATISIPNSSFYQHNNNSFFNDNTLYKIINNTNTKELRYFDFYQANFDNYIVDIFVDPLKNSQIVFKTYNNNTPKIETINISKKEIVPVYVYLFTKDDYPKMGDPINNTLNLTSGIPYLLNVYKRNTSIDDLVNITKKVQINDGEVLSPYNYIQNGTNYYINEDLQKYQKFIKELNSRFYIDKIEFKNCSGQLHYKVDFDMQQFEFNLVFSKPEINNIYDIVDVFIDEPDDENFERIYYMVDLFIEC